MKVKKAVINYMRYKRYEDFMVLLDSGITEDEFYDLLGVQTLIATDGLESIEQRQIDELILRGWGRCVTDITVRYVSIQYWWWSKDVNDEGNINRLVQLFRMSYLNELLNKDANDLLKHLSNDINLFNRHFSDYHVGDLKESDWIYFFTKEEIHTLINKLKESTYQPIDIYNTLINDTYQTERTRNGYFNELLHEEFKQKEQGLRQTTKRFRGYFRGIHNKK